ncbi:MAG: MFS transporter [Myxococcota bacterium]|nr:MFS transporter [Myxococcota bacterium]
MTISPSPKDPLFTRPFILLVLAHFMQALGWSSMLLLPIYIKHLGSTEAQLGTIMAIASVGGLLLRPLVGWSLDYVGRRPTLIAGTVLLTVGMFMLGWIDSLGVEIYLARVLIGVGAGTLFTGYFTYVADFIPSSRRTEGLALFGVSGLLPVGFNAFVYRLEIPVERMNDIYPAVSGLVIASIILLLGVPESRKKTVDDSSPNLGEVKTSLTQRTLLPTWFATIIFSTLVAVLMTYVTVTASHRGVESAPDLWAYYATGAVGVRLLGGRLPDKIGPSNIVVPALSTYVLAFILAADAQTYSQFCLAGFLAGLGHGYCFPVLTSQVVSRMDDQLRGIGLATFTAIWELTSVGMTPLYGLISDWYGQAVMFSSAAVVATSCCAAWVWLEHNFSPASPE